MGCSCLKAIWVFLYNFNLFFWLCWVFVALLGFFSSCDEQGYSLSLVVCRLLIALTSFVAEPRL